MAAVATADLISHFPISEIPTAQVDYALLKATAEVSARVGVTAYAAAIAATPTDATASAFILEAVELFSIARLLRNTGLRLRKNGFVIKETDAGSPAMGGGSNITNEYLNPKDQKLLAEQFRNEALENLTLAGVESKQPLYKFVSCSDVEASDSIRRQTSSEWNE